MTINRYVNQLPPLCEIGGYAEPVSEELCGKSAVCKAVCGKTVSLSAASPSEMTITIDDKTTADAAYTCIKLRQDAYAVCVWLQGGFMLLALDFAHNAACAIDTRGQDTLIPLSMNGQKIPSSGREFDGVSFNLLFGPYTNYLHIPSIKGGCTVADACLGGDDYALHFPMPRNGHGLFLFTDALCMRGVGFAYSKDVVVPVAGCGGFISDDDLAEVMGHEL